MTLKKVLAGAVAVATAAALLAGTAACSREEDPNAPEASSPSSQDSGNVENAAAHSDETYYWIAPMSTLPLFVANDYPGWHKAGKELGVKTKMVGPTDQDLGKLIATINQVCAQKPAGVSVVGWDPSLKSAVNKCIAEGVPVVTDDADLPGSDRLAFIGTNWYDIGVAQAKALMDAAEPGPVATTSIIGADNMTQARQGFKDTLKDSGFTVVADEDDKGDVETAASVTSSLLAAHPDLVGIAGFDANSGPGIVQAVKEAGKAGKIAIASMQATPEFFQTIKDGTVSAIVVQKRELFTYYALKTLYDYNHNGLTIEGLPKDSVYPIPANIDTGLLTVTKDNVDTVIAAQAKKPKE